MGNRFIVKQIELGQKLIWLPVRVVVTDARFGNSISVGSGARRDDGNIGICFVDRFEKRGESVFLVRLPARSTACKPVLIANFNVVKLERLGVSELGAFCTPGRIGRSSDELDLIECVVDPGLKLVFGNNVAVKRETAVNTDDCTLVIRARGLTIYDELTQFHAHIFSPEEVFHKTEAVGHLITPGVLESPAISKRTETGLPVPPCVDGISFQHVASGEAEKGL